MAGAGWAGAGAGAISDISWAGLGHAGGAQLGVALIDGRLHLLENLINRGQIASGLCVAHRGQAIGLDGVGLFIGTTKRDGLISGDRDTRRDDLR